LNFWTLEPLSVFSSISYFTFFLAFNISSIPRIQNASADLLSNVASKLIPLEDYSLDRFSIELIFGPSILDNITNWLVFNDDEDILNFLTSEKSYDDQIIDEDEHDNQLKNKINDNPMPKSIVKLKDIYDLKDRFKKVTNSKLKSSTLRFELINLRTDLKPWDINLRLCLSSNERLFFIHLLKKYKYIFYWSY